MLLVFGAALALRLGHLWALNSSFAGSDLFSIPLVDAAHHWKEALAILRGDSPLGEGVPWKGPGYSYFLAGLAAIFGPSAGAVRWPLAVLGSANCALLVLLARRVLDLRWSVVAGLLAACNGLLIVYDTELHHPTLLITLNLGALLLLTRKRTTPAAFAGAGFLLGLACLVHPAYLLPAVLLVAWALRRGLRHAAALAAATALTILPLTLNNVLAHGEPVLISWNGGVNAYVGNHPTFDQHSANSVQSWGRILQAPLDAGIDSESERDRLYYRLTVERAVRYPLATAGVLLKKAIVFFSPVEYSSNFPIYDLREWSPVAGALLRQWGAIWVPFGLWIGAALCGLVILLREQRAVTVPPAVWAFAVLLTNVLVFNTARYRAPIVFIGCIWVAAALAAAWRLWRTGRLRRLAALAAVYAGLTLGGALIAVPQPDFPPPYEWHQALALKNAGRFDAGVDWAERAVERDPESPSLLLFVSDYYARRDHRDRQREYLRRLLALPNAEPDTIDVAHERLAASYFAQERFDESRASLLEAIAVGVDDAEWNGYPHYPLGIGPIRRCVLNLRLADVEMRRGDPAAAGRILASVREQCPASSRFTDELDRLEHRLPP
jgi:tetratricopeptide (TPR) repeat protein